MIACDIVGRAPYTRTVYWAARKTCRRWRETCDSGVAPTHPVTPPTDRRGYVSTSPRRAASTAVSLCSVVPTAPPRLVSLYLSVCLSVCLSVPQQCHSAQSRRQRRQDWWVSVCLSVCLFHSSVTLLSRADSAAKTGESLCLSVCSISTLTVLVWRVRMIVVIVVQIQHQQHPTWAVLVCCTSTQPVCVYVFCS